MSKFAVTIAREYGSGGRIIGKQLAQELGIAFYDKELITLAARESGLHEDFIQTIEQKKASGFFYNLYMTYGELPIHEQVFLAQSKAIKELAEKGACVIIGRCADYVLGEDRNRIRIFVHAPMAWRVRIAREEYTRTRIIRRNAYESTTRGERRIIISSLNRSGGTPATMIFA
jgi:cytidylate kinase